MKNKSILFILCALVLMDPAGFAQMNPKVKFEEALKLVQNHYVDPVDDEHLVDVAIGAMLTDLDPHSQYVSREEAEAMKSAMEGVFAGIGIQYLKDNESTRIIQVNPDGPAMRAGVKVGDRIVTIDGEDITGIEVKNQDILTKLRGERGSEVVLGIRSSNAEAVRLVPIIRENIIERSVQEAYMVDKETGYLSLAIFNNTTRKEIDEAIEKLQDQGMKKLIFNLQGNRGGYVEAAIGVADEFLPKGKIVFYSVSNTGAKDYYFTGGFGRFYDGEMVVLIDEITASSSEIVAGALQDWDRAVIVGRRSFGKGLMQRTFPLPDGSELHLTGARYYTPSGRSIQRPYDKGREDYYNEFNRRMESKELLEEGHVSFADSLKFSTLTNKRIVYGGGGIMPDYFVPINIHLYSDWMTNLMNSGLVTNLCFEYVEQNRTPLTASHPDFAAFSANFAVTDSLRNKLIAEAEAVGIAVPNADKSAKESIDVELKSRIASLLYADAHYGARVHNEADRSFQAAMKILNDENLYRKLLNEQPSSKQKKGKR